MNGRTSSYEWPSTVTWSSCMHSSSAAWVFGDARLISSTSSRLAKTGPGRNSNSFERWLKTLTPVTSDGSRSGVNCRREKEQSIDRANAFASVVLPTPGRSSMIRWPSASRERTVNCSVSAGACTTPARFATMRPIDSSEPIRVAALRSGSSISAPSGNAAQFRARSRHVLLDGALVPLPVVPPSFWVASTKPEAALARGQGWQPWQEGGWALAPRDRGPEAGMYCWKGHLLRHQLHDLVEDLGCNSLLRRLRDPPLPRCGDQHDLVLARVETDVFS